MNNIIISAIIPVYNPGEGISECIKRLRNQTLKEIEMIFVDDLGNDDSMDKVRAAAAEDPRIRIITNPKNVGPGIARNVGIEASRGEYLSFIDPDDYIAEDFYELLYKKAKAKDLDIVKGSICYVREDGSIFPHFNTNDVIRNYLKAGRPIYMSFTYGHQSAIYKREMLMASGARYGLARRSQDTTFLLQACNAAKSIEIEDSALYYFCERFTSTMHTVKVKSLDDLLQSFQERTDYICSNLGDDPWAILFVSNDLLTGLRYYLRYEGVPENEPFLRAYLDGLKDQLRRLPFYKKLKKYCLSARILDEKGIPLPILPGHLPWEAPDLDEFSSLLMRWVDFLSANPSYCRAPKDVLWLLRLCGSMYGVGAEKGKKDATREKIFEIVKPLGIHIWILIRLYFFAGRVAKYLPF